MRGIRVSKSERLRAAHWAGHMVKAGRSTEQAIRMVELKRGITLYGWEVKDALRRISGEEWVTKGLCSSCKEDTLTPVWVRDKFTSECMRCR